MRNYKDGLSIVIPTYNRREKLFALLNSIFEQAYNLVDEIIILDNSSDYDVNDLCSNFPTEKIRIEINELNIGMSSNLAKVFSVCETKWMWLISDDDILVENSIEIVNENIHQNISTSYLKFSIEGIGESGLEDNISVSSLEDLLDYSYSKRPLHRGNFVFVSNGVFNLEILDKYLGRAFQYSYTYIGYLIPVLFSLQDKNNVTFSNEVIIKYNNPGLDFWSFEKVGLGLSTISHIKFDINKFYHKRLLNFLMAVPYKLLYTYLLKEENFYYRNSFRLIYNSIYKYYLNYVQRLFCLFLIQSFNFPKTSRLLLRKFKELKR